ncbi:MAG: TonB-dependent receptor [Pseudohongiellaceae bacterium]
MHKRLTANSSRVMAAELALGLLCCTALPGAGAQEVTTPGVIVTDSGNRVIYTGEYFSQYNVITASDQLQRVPGIQDIGGGGNFNDDQRGFGSSGDQMLINGKRVSGKSNDVGSVLQRIQARQVVQIEVIRGAVPGLDVRSQGRVVNVVLEDTLTTGYGSVTGSVEHYSEGSLGSGAEFSYNGDLAALNYLVSVEGDVRKDFSESLDRFFTPGDILFARQLETFSSSSNEITASANTSYTFPGGNVLNVNAFYADEEDSGDETSQNYLVVNAIEFPDDSQLNDETEFSRNWELGGDYQHVFANGNILTTLFIYSSAENAERGAFSFMPQGATAQLQDVQIEASLSKEKILRSTYQWALTEDHLFESGAEVAVNSVDEDASLFENTGGSLLEVPLFNEESTIEEVRYEAFTSYSWQAADQLLLESSLDLEHSEIQQSGADVEHSRDFFYVRPRLALRYDLSEQTQLRGRIERTISQLDFGAFIASFTNDDNRFDVINAGNPELEPEKTWEYELSYERQLLGDRGVITVTALYSDVTDHIGRIPLQVATDDGVSIRTAPGNLGDGYAAELEISGSLRLDWLSLEGAVLDLSLARQNSRVTDPFSGEKREFNFSSDYEWSLAYRQDLNWKSLSWGIETGTESPRPQYDLDFSEESEDGLDLEIFVEMQPMTDVTLRLEAENVLRAESQRERLEYSGIRGRNPLDRRELRTSRPVREISLGIQWVF